MFTYNTGGRKWRLRYPNNKCWILCEAIRRTWEIVFVTILVRTTGSPTNSMAIFNHVKLGFLSSSEESWHFPLQCISGLFLLIQFSIYQSILILYSAHIQVFWKIRSAHITLNKYGVSLFKSINNDTKLGINIAVFRRTDTDIYQDRCIEN